MAGEPDVRYKRLEHTVTPLVDDVGQPPDSVHGVLLTDSTKP